ncbi:hypothetical protein GC209_16750 [bacterium]|nr:hypothetical protein [bacterium]
MRRLLCALILIAAPLMARAATAGCVQTSFEDTPFTYCTATAGSDLRLFLNGADGRPYGGFDEINAALAQTGRHLAFAMNAGMFQPDQTPVGLYIEDGRLAHRIVTRNGPGNFGMLPNGVFCIGARFSVVESRSFAANPPDCRYASQSGPMLVIKGQLHPQFRANSTSYKIRNGVGVSADGKTAWFAISDAAVTFDRFARFFRDSLGARDALFFDGSISRLYAADLGRSGSGFAVGPIVGLVEGN